MRLKAIRLVTELSKSAGAEVIMSVAGYVWRALLSRNSHVPMAAKWCALERDCPPAVRGS